ncbi:NGG1 interacting factor 3-like protein [Mycena crocata]|nr:NGG1 interacting factor 3-like protein [Mycena crocata]
MAILSNVLTKAVCNAMKRIAPPVLAGSWDNTGLILESPIKNGTKNRVLLTIDLTTAVCDEAIAKNVSMVVAYHPPIFSGLKSLTLATPLQATLLRCAAAGISIYSPHSALDGVTGGINDWLVECLGGDENLVSGLGAKHDETLGAPGRSLRFEPPVAMSVLQGRIKRSLGLSHIQVGYSPLRPDRMVSTVAICAGSGGGLFSETKAVADLYFTGEMQHHDVLAALASGTHVMLCGHTNTERGYLPTLAAKLRAELEVESASVGDTEVLISEADAHPLQVV